MLLKHTTNRMETFVVLIYITGLMKMTAWDIPSCCRPDSETLDCSNCGLRELYLPEMNITSLNLNHNFIITIKAYAFSRLKELRHLSLYNNGLWNFDENAFDGLKKLETLDIRMEKCIDFSFKSMKSLRILKMGRACSKSAYRQLSTTLEFLEISVNLDFVFGRDFSHLRGLKTLVLNGNDCNLGKANNKTFEAFFSSLQTLEIRRCQVIELNDAFSLFQGLRTLNFACSTGINLGQIVESIEQMQVASLETLIADFVSYGYENLAAHLFTSSNFANLTQLSLRKIKNIPDFHNFSNVPSLQSLNCVYNSRRDRDLGTVLSQLIGGLSHSIASFDISFGFRDDEKLYDKFCSFDRPMYSEDFFMKHPYFIRAKTPSHSLQFIYARNVQTFYVGILSTLSLYPDNVLYIDLSGTWVNKFSGPIENGNNLQGLDFSGCGMKNINSALLDTLPSLIYLNFSDNKLNNFREWNRLFRNASQIKTLDLSSNGLRSIPENIFEGLTSLETVTMGHNYLGKVFIDLTKNKNLKMLDLRNISFKPTQKLLETIDSLQKQIGLTPKLKLYLQDNYFECECNNLFFLRWLFDTSVDVVGMESLQCYPPDPTYISEDLVQKLTSDCKDRKLSVILVAPFASMAILLLVVLLVRNYRWTIKRKFYLLRRRVHYNLLLKRNDGPIPLVDDYTTYHAFVSYRHINDCKWVRDELIPKAEDDWGLKLCVGERDFIAGIPISENICEAIDKSRYVILVITPSFVTSEWCDFEMHMALVKGRRHLAIVYLEDVEPKDMSKTLKALMSTVNYIEYNNTPDGNALFWQRLKDKLTSHVNKIDT